MPLASGLRRLHDIAATREIIGEIGLLRDVACETAIALLVHQAIAFLNLRKAHSFNKKRAVRVPKTGYRQDGSAVYRKGNEYLIVRSDNFGVEKIVTYGVNDDD